MSRAALATLVVLLLLGPAGAQPVQPGTDLTVRAGKAGTVILSLGDLGGQLPSPEVLAAVNLIIRWQKRQADPALPVTVHGAQAPIVTLQDTAIILPASGFSLAGPGEVRVARCKVRVRQVVLPCPLVVRLAQTSTTAPWVVVALEVP